MLAALSAPTTPISAVLAGPWEDDLCKGSKQQAAAVPSMMQLPSQPVSKPQQLLQELQHPASPSARLDQTTDQEQPQQQAAQQVKQPVQQQQASTPVVGSLPTPQLEQARQHRERRPSRSAPVSPVRGASSSPQTSNRAGYSTDAYWDNRYAEKSTHFDWFYNYSALAPLINKACDQCAPCLHVGCGNSGLSTGMAKDGFQVRMPAIGSVVALQVGTGM